VVDIPDPALAAAVARALGHEAPFSDDELGGLRALRVVGASDVEPLAACPALEELALVGCELEDLDCVAGLSRLRRLQVLGCPVEDADAVAGCAALEELRVDFTFLEELEPFTRLPSLRRGRLLGNPWRRSCFEELRPRWLRAPSPRWGKPPIVEMGAQAQWELQLVLWQSKRLCYALLDGARPVLVRPGVSSLVEGAEVDVTIAIQRSVSAGARAPDLDPEFMFNAFLEDCDPEALRRFDFESHRVLGDRDDAEAWIAAAGDLGADGERLRAFVRRFPDAIFYREDDLVLELVEKAIGEPLPAPLARARKVLAGAFPEEAARFRLGSFSGPSPRADRLDKIWYYPKLGEAGAGERKTLLERARLIVVGDWLETAQSLLGVKRASTDGAIFEVSEDDLYDAQSEGKDPSEQPGRVFASYAELLGHITAFKLDDKSVITATEGA
jgi:hypothetical protein